MLDALQQLNPEQLAAVTATEGYVRVIAGAGSGKTKALTYRYAYLVQQMGILPENILCLTFSNKAANEMRQRIRGMIPDCGGGYIATFHSFCVTVLQEDIHALQYPERFLVLDNRDIDAILQMIYEERGLSLQHMSFAKARDMIEIKKLFEEPEYYLDVLAMPLDILRQKYLQATAAKDIIFYGYLYQQKKCFGLDYNDLLKFTLYLFAQHGDIRQKWQERLTYIMVDEFQDIDDLQYQLLQTLAAYHQNLFVVGDPDQTIYSWRGANGKYLLNFDKDFPQTVTIMMMKNYRSTPEIVAAANSLIRHNKQRIAKDLQSLQASGEKPVYFHGTSAQEEAAWICDRIEELQEQDVPLASMAILYRAHYLSRVIEEALLKKEIPYYVYNGIQFLDRSEIKDALAYLRLIALGDDLSFARTVNRPKRNIGEQRMAALRSYSEEHSCSLLQSLEQNIDAPSFKNTKGRQFLALIEEFSAAAAAMSVSELAGAVLERSGYEAALRTAGDQTRLDNLAEFKQSIYEYETTCGEEVTLENYLRHIALFNSADISGPREGVRLTTVHTAKGLEFPYVFLCGLNEGIFPSKKILNADGMEEERRLAFVAVTRAEKGLFLSDSQGRNLDGSIRFPSRFLFNIDPDLLHFVRQPDEILVKQAKDRILWHEQALAQSGGEAAFRPGETVIHPLLGEGKILDTDEKTRAYTIQFCQTATPRRISFQTRLQKR
ncbi:MAG: UvrD-helicase domain-containing protein [Firmicutes bacterium]|nr:UvrD-helicase domain-containing protein [Bacillota bacterium]